jgi:hypothetical protein
MSTQPKYLGLAIAAALGMASMQGHAALITDWDYTATLDWLPGSTVFQALDNAPNPGNNTAGNFTSPQIISWGDPAGDEIAPPPAGSGRSALHIGPNSLITGSLGTNAGPEDSFSVTHYNNVVDQEFQVLDSTALTSTLTLTSTAPASEAGEVIALPALEFVVDFEETFNADPCGFPEQTGAACADIFVIDFQALSQQFVIGDFIYTVSIDVEDLIELSEQAATIAGSSDDPAFGIITPEGGENVFAFNFQIDAQPVPNPGSMALLGAGILGLGFAVRRRRSRK